MYPSGPHASVRLNRYWHQYTANAFHYVIKHLVRKCIQTKSAFGLEEARCTPLALAVTYFDARNIPETPIPPSILKC